MKIENEPDLVRDMESGAILNVNRQSLQAYKQRKENQKLLVDTVDTLEKRINNLEAIIAKLTKDKV